MRLDELLVQRELCADLHDARASIMAGEVVVGEHRATSAGMRVTDDTAVRLKEGKRRGGFVSRGGLKLQRALDAFAIDVTGLSCVDLGASSGGFTDCLLQRGAAHVSAVDVGAGQFDWGLRNDTRVSLFERTNIRNVTADDIGGPAGNIEFLFWAKNHGTASRQEGSMCFDEIERVVAEAHAELKGDS